MALSTSNAITPKQLAETWEAHSLNKNVTELTPVTFSAYRTAVLKDYEASATVLHKKRPTVTPTPGKRPRTEERLLDESSSSRRVSFSPSSLVASTTPVLPCYSERTRVGTIVASYGNPISPSHIPPPTCIIHLNPFGTNVTKPYRHMFTTLHDRAQRLEQALQHAEDEWVNDNNNTDNDDDDTPPLEAVGVPRQALVTCIGRICNEAHQGTINATSILLEGSKRYSNGARVALNLSHLIQHKIPFSLFPGQVVTVQGMNGTGRTMMAHAISMGVPPPLPPPMQQEAPLKIMAACGPYTSSDSLDYQPHWRNT
jgi:DNA polymerase alpha subunit B